MLRDAGGAEVVKHVARHIDSIHSSLGSHQFRSGTGKKARSCAQIRDGHAGTDAELAKHLQGRKEFIAFWPFKPLGVGWIKFMHLDSSGLFSFDAPFLQTVPQVPFGDTELFCGSRLVAIL